MNEDTMTYKQAEQMLDLLGGIFGELQSVVGELQSLNKSVREGFQLPKLPEIGPTLDAFKRHARANQPARSLTTLH